MHLAWFSRIFFIHAFMHTLRTSIWISCISLKTIEFLYNEDTSLNLSNRNLLWATMSKVATVWLFSLLCIMSKKCLLMKQTHFGGICCTNQRMYFNWQTGPLPRAILLFFLTSYLKDMKETFLPLIVLLIFFLHLKFSFTHFNF